ncbi:hypothetical protein H0H92_003418 [Tricholoma furcatifolium]|nr:hypothetical protein H0H92_003418 [Tricholoma furcatifolium]
MELHENTLKYYKIHYNALSTSFCLPPEILGAIFKEVVTMYHYDRHHGTKSLEWIMVISHVCSRWREVALSTERLWSNIPIESPEWAMEMIRRSNTAPLTIEYCGGTLHSIAPSGPFDVLQTIFISHLSLVKSLDLRFEASDLVEDRVTILLELLKKPSKIQHLGIRIDGIFMEVTSLKHLVLDGCGMTFQPVPHVRSLRSLNFSTRVADNVPSITQLLYFLSQQKRTLREIVISSPLKSSATQGGILMEQIRMKRLIHVDMTCALTSLTLFFDHVVSPNARYIRLVSSPLHRGQTVESSISLVRNLAQKLDSGSDRAIALLQLRDAWIKCWKPNTSSIPPLLESPTMDILLPSECYDTFPCGPLLREAFVESLNLNEMVSLELTGWTATDHFWSLLGTLPCLQDLRVVANEACLSRTLCRGMKMSLATDELPPSFKALKHLKLEQWLKYRIPGRLARMLQCFQLRNKAGLQRLELLEMKDCEVDEEEPCILKKMARVVVIL